MATNTTATSQTHNGNGSTATFAISFSFLENSEVDVTVGGVLKTLGTHYNISGSSVTFTSGNIPPSGTANIKFQRDTDISAKKVDFADGSFLTETDLDNNSDQVLFAQQEIIDKLGGIEEGATGDQTAAEIRTLVGSASDSNVLTDALLSKLNAIESGATGNQNAAEIKSLIASSPLDTSHIADGAIVNADVNASAAIAGTKVAPNFGSQNIQTSGDISGNNLGASGNITVGGTVDGRDVAADGSKLDGIDTGAKDDQTASEIKTLIASSPLDSSHLAANSVGSSEIASNAVTTDKIADAELTTLAGMQSGTASKLADSTALTSDIADLNQLDGMAKQTTITDDDTKFPTSGAVVDFVAAQIAPIGGLEVIATDAAFPNTQPSSGVVISISDAGGVAFNGSGSSTTARTVGGSTVTINNAPSSLNNETLVAGVGLMVSSTGSGQIYNYHKILGKEDDIKQLSDDINDFNARYRVGSSNPTSALDAGDLFYNTSTSKLLVYNATNSAWEEAQSVGNFFISTFSESVDGSRTDFTISNAPTTAQQIILSINGVVQKPNAGTSTPSEGFALSGSTVKLSSAPPSGSDIFIVVLGSTVNIGTPSNNTVTTAILQNSSVTTAKIADNAITNSKIADLTVSGAEIANTTIAGTKLVNGAISNDQVNVSAAIAGTKISPDFGSQNITTTGNLGVNTTAPVEKLGVAGNMRFVNATGETKRIIALPSGGYNLGTTGGSAIAFHRISDGGGGSDEIAFETHYQGNRHAESARISKFGGITFNGDTAAANALDDYEEGTWTPRIQGTGSNNSKTYVTQLGEYTKIGHMVWVRFRVRWSARTTDSGSAAIFGLPYACTDNIGIGGAMAYSTITFGGTSSSKPRDHVLETIDNDSGLLIITSEDGETFSNVAASIVWTSSGEVRGSAFYTN